MSNPDFEGKSKKALNIMATASNTLREAISRSLPVAPNQLLTVTVPGTVVNYHDYYWSEKENTFAPLNVRVNEARLVDGMLPLSKISMGKSGKSVARAYISALDLLMPVEASVSDTVQAAADIVDPRRKIIKERYDGAMKYLTSSDENSVANGQPQSKLNKYVEKQEHWSKAVERYASAQHEKQMTLASQYPNSLAMQKNEYLAWVQSKSRDYKAAIQARYMDWVVHGYKFNIEFNFGIVDISSGMKRVEASKEAYRNLVIIAEDGFSEYSQVRLEPSNWAEHVKNKVENWNDTHKGPTPDEIKVELKRLRNLLTSHEVLLEKVSAPGFTAALPAPDSAGEATLKDAYGKVYAEQSKRSDILSKVRQGFLGATVAPESQDSKNAWTALLKAQDDYKNGRLAATNQAVAQTQQSDVDALKVTLKAKITTLKEEIDDLKKSLPAGGALLPPILGENGTSVADDELKKDSELFKKPTVEPTGSQGEKLKADPWTRITASVKSSESESTKVSTESASSVAAKAGFGLWKASGGASHASSSVDAMASMANLDVEVSMDCMVVNIERPWLHGELFTDSEIDVGPDFALSPGENALREVVEQNQNIDEKYQQFPAYPTAFVIAANVELNFSGDTSMLSSSVSSSSTEANVSVGWGPFGVSASHKQSKTKSKTRTESTATGMRIALQAPQIIGWVQTLLPALPRKKTILQGLALGQGGPSAPPAAGNAAAAAGNAAAGGATARPSGS